jgi:DNA-binding CsgD family transcriptional regulator
MPEPDSGPPLEQEAQAAYLEQDYDRAIELHERAYAAYRDARDDLGAVRVAGVLAWLNGGYRGNGAVMSGWLARAQTLVGDQDRVERGWVALHSALFEGSRPVREEHLQRALATARRFGDADLEFYALAQLGSSWVHGDRVADGMALLDEALAAVAGGEVTYSLAIENIFCQLYAACEHARDINRADQWIRVGEQIASKRNLPAVAAWCRTHYGAILTAAGRWTEADSQLTEALRLWTGSFANMRSHALIRLADLRVRQGRFDEARQLLQGCELNPAAAWPLAAIHAERGERALAVDVLERALGEIDADGSAAAPLWALLVEVLLSAGSPPEAQAAATRLEGIAQRLGSPYLRATAALARGRLCLATGEGDPRACLREALSGFAEAMTPMELAHARFELARALTDERPEVAVAEAKAALEAYERLQAVRHADATAALLRALGAPVRRGGRGDGSLTKREAEVLELLGRGLSNPEIADRLYITRKTVEHHVGSLLSKLGLRSRAEAAAYTARFGKSSGE